MHDQEFVSSDEANISRNHRDHTYKHDTLGYKFVTASLTLQDSLIMC